MAPLRKCAQQCDMSAGRVGTGLSLPRSLVTAFSDSQGTASQAWVLEPLRIPGRAGPGWRMGLGRIDPPVMLLD